LYLTTDDHFRARERGRREGKVVRMEGKKGGVKGEGQREEREEMD